MQTLLPYLAIVIVVLTGYGIFKKYQVNIVLLFAGLSMNALAVIAGIDHILPKGAASTGFIGFDLFELLRAVSRNQLFSTGFVILVAGGFATYMEQIGASDKLVQLCLKPLRRLAMPYVVLGAVFVIGHFLGLVVTSAAGLAMLLIVSVYPVLIGLGVSGVGAAAVIGSVLIYSYAPSSVIAVLSAKTAGVDPMEYLIGHQLVSNLPGVLAALIAHVCVQKYLDQKDRAAGRIAAVDNVDLSQSKTTDKSRNVPTFYAFFPLIPLSLLFVFNKLVYKTIVLDVATAMFIGWVVALIIDWAYRRDTTRVFADGAAMFRGMGNMLTNVVGLIFVAMLFAAGLQNTGLVALMIEAAKNAGLGLAGTGLIMSLVIGIITVLTGSGVASFTALVPLAPTIAEGFGGSAVDLALMMQIASECLRPVSPVAGVVIIVAGFAKVSPLAVVRRTIVPCLAAAGVSIAVTIWTML